MDTQQIQQIQQQQEEPQQNIALGSRMKGYEDNMKIQIEKNKPFVIRLDGHAFSKFTKNFVRPYDIRIHNAMLETANILMKTFMPTTIYTFSDEITMCFPSIPIDEQDGGDGNGNGSDNSVEIPNLAYSGKVQKLITLTAGLASTVFYKTIVNQNYDADKEKQIIKLLRESTPHFDSRLFVLPSNDEIRSNLIWRSLVDCKRNSVANLGHAHFTQKEMHSLNNNQVKQKLLDEKGIDYYSEPKWYIYGVYLKKQTFTLNTTSPLEPEKEISTKRTRVSSFSFDITKLLNSNDFITTKILSEDFKLEFNNK